MTGLNQNFGQFLQVTTNIVKPPIRYIRQRHVPFLLLQASLVSYRLTYVTAIFLRETLHLKMVVLYSHPYHEALYV